MIFAHHCLSIHVIPSKLSGLCSCVFNLYNETKFSARVSKLPIPQRSEQTRRETGVTVGVARGAAAPPWDSRSCGGTASEMTTASWQAPKLLPGFLRSSSTDTLGFDIQHRMRALVSGFHQFRCFHGFDFAAVPEQPPRSRQYSAHAMNTAGSPSLPFSPSKSLHSVSSVPHKTCLPLLLLNTTVSDFTAAIEQPTPEIVGATNVARSFSFPLSPSPLIPNTPSFCVQHFVRRMACKLSLLLQNPQPSPLHHHILPRHPLKSSPGFLVPPLANTLGFRIQPPYLPWLSKSVQVTSKFATSPTLADPRAHFNCRSSVTSCSLAMSGRFTRLKTSVLLNNLFYDPSFAGLRGKLTPSGCWLSEKETAKTSVSQKLGSATSPLPSPSPLLSFTHSVST